MIRKLAAGLLAGAAMLPVSASPTQAAGPAQYRALWVDAFHAGMKSPQQVEKLVADAQRANVNTLIVQVRKRGDAYFNRSLEPRASDIQGPMEFDPLDYLLRLAHASAPRIEVHAWVNVYFAGQSSLVYAQYGSAWGNKANDGATSGFLDPGVPEVAIYTQRLFVDLVRNYDVDGLHLDFVRYPGAAWGYSASAVELYKLQGGVTRTPDPADAKWQAWRRDRVTAFVRDLHKELKLEKPSLKLSGALICFGGGPYNAAGWGSTSAYTSVFQDWRAWLVKGYLDFGVPMNYDSDWNGQQKAWFDRWIAFEKDSGFANRVVVGVGAFLNYPEDTLAQIRRVLAASTGGNRVLGVAIYSYASTSVYGSDDYYGSTDLAGGLPRQPYAGGITSPSGLADRARSFNDLFMTQLSHAASYKDVQLGTIATQPVFTQAATVPGS
ncbi:MAG TPA: family 10 glycosylhydrolase [Candidatus Dormibacteraeota bacterium]